MANSDKNAGIAKTNLEFTLNSRKENTIDVAKMTGTQTDSGATAASNEEA